MDEIQKLKEYILDLEARIQDLKKDLIHDSLTGLKTRRFFEDRARVYLSNIEKIEEGKRRDWFGFRNLSFLFVDVDNFKKINDIYGHAVGDEVLKSISETISENVRGGDVAARWGGEEIMIMLLGANEDDARSKAENIRKSVEDQSFEIVPGLKVTISVGVAMYTKGINLDQLVKNSDLALYKAKEKGRNNVVAFSEI
jgi:diguanylate cyclase (GGDEF)-like protein